MTQVADETLVLVDDLGDGVARITFNRAAKRNAMNQAARSGIVEGLDRLRGEAKVIILTGSGSAFCSGIDLKEELSRPAGYVPPDTIENRRTVWAWRPGGDPDAPGGHHRRGQRSCAWRRRHAGEHR